jgi:hypothetical protein
MTIDSQFRQPTIAERALFDRLLKAEFPGRPELAALLRDVSVKTCDNDGSLVLRVAAEGTAPVNQRIPVEAEGKDEDGAKLHALLHVPNGRPNYLEFFREDAKTVKRIPHPETWELIVLPPAPKNGWPDYGRGSA